MLVRLRLIGQMEAWTLNSESILPTGRKTRALLAILALSAPRTVLRTKLAELLWSRRPEEQARASLRQEVHRLLEYLRPVGSQVLAVHRDHLGLQPGTVWVDVEEVLRASPNQPAALALLDGELLEGLDGIDQNFDLWLTAERERLGDRARGLAEALLRDKTDPETVIAVAQQLLAIDRTHEGAWRAIMKAYAGLGERGMAIQSYDRCRAALHEMLDAEPSEETHRLLVEIKAAGHAARSAANLATRSDLRLFTRPEPRPAPRGEPRHDVPRTDVRPAPTPRGGARIGVMPLQMVGTTDAEAHLAAGLADEITSALARFRWMFLVSSNSLARYASQTRDETAIRRAFNIDFLLDGVIQRAGTRLRVMLRLLDLRAGNQVVWSRRFDRETGDLLTLQDDIAAEVVAQIDPEILLIESARVTARSPHDASAYDLVLRSVPLISRLDRPQFLEAGTLLARAVTLEPDYAAAHAWYAYWHLFLVGQHWTSERAEALAEAGRLAERAITLDPQDARALTIAGHVRAFLHHRVREAVALHSRALLVNPNLAMAWAMSAMAHTYLGDLAQAKQQFARHKQLSPYDPQAFFFDGVRIIIGLLEHDHEGAVAAGREVSQMNPSFSSALKPYLAALGYAGPAAETEAVLGRLLAMEPDFSIASWLEANPWERAEDRSHFAEGLRRASVPE